MANELPKKTPFPKFTLPKPKDLAREQHGEPQGSPLPQVEPQPLSPPLEPSEVRRHSTPPTTSEVDEGDDVYTLASHGAQPRIRVSPGEIHRIAAAAERVLAADGAYFHAGGPIVRVIDRPGGGVVSEAVNDQTLVTELSSKIYWEKKGQRGEWVRSDPPQSVVQNLMRGQDRPHLKALEGLARQPFLGPDRRFITSPGYHEETGIYAAFNGGDYDLKELTRDKAEHALDCLQWLIEEVPFASEADRSAALAAMLTAAIRPSIPQTPAFSLTASRSGSGKSYLANIIAAFAGPGDPYITSYPTKADEATKVVVAMLLEKPAVILFDDMQTDWKSFGAINKALTSPTVTERMLGSTRTATARTNVLILGTGNNIEPERDMRRRVLSIRLEPRSETPAFRRYRKDDPVEHLRKHRKGAVGDALTIIGAFLAAGAPHADVKPIGTYDGWSTFCRQPLLWLGLHDPAQSLIDQVTHDPDQQLLEEFLTAWSEIFASRPVTVRKVVATAMDHPNFMDILTELPVVDGRHVNPGKLGWFLNKNRGRRAGGFRIEPGDSKERRTWRVVLG